MKELKVRLKNNPYTIVVGNHILPRLPRYLRTLGISGKIFIVSNRQVGKLYLSALQKGLRQSGFETAAYTDLPNDESAKTGQHLLKLQGAMVRAGLDRSSAVLALGGGVVGDLAGFAAATFMRGIRWVGVPTTLLAQVDSSIGGKTGINLPQGKNLVGSFHQPVLVFSDTAFLRTLPDAEIRYALAEVIKYAVIWSQSFFAYLEKNILKARAKNMPVLEKIVTQCALIKKTVVERDEFETTGLRALLNYGHTFGHGFEGAGADWKTALSHGQAVALGMLAAGDLAVHRGGFSTAQRERQKALIAKAGLDLHLPRGIKLRTVLECMRHDKKKAGKKLKFILPLTIGKAAVCSDIPDQAVAAAIKGLY